MKTQCIHRSRESHVGTWKNMGVSELECLAGSIVSDGKRMDYDFQANCRVDSQLNLFSTNLQYYFRRKCDSGKQQIRNVLGFYVPDPLSNSHHNSNGYCSSLWQWMASHNVRLLLFCFEVLIKNQTISRVIDMVRQKKTKRASSHSVSKFSQSGTNKSPKTRTTSRKRVSKSLSRKSKTSSMKRK